MRTAVCSKGLEERMAFIEMIQSGIASVGDAEAEHHACYLCLKSIRGRMKVVSFKEYTPQGTEMDVRRQVHEFCYQQARHGFLSGRENPLGFVTSLQ